MGEYRPRTTKNVYFFKSGDSTNGVIRVPVNLRKHRTLDALLDDLSTKAPELSHGVRQLRTSRGRTVVTDLSQLEHLGGYVLTEKLNPYAPVKGVDISKVPGTKTAPSTVPSTTVSSASNNYVKKTIVAKARSASPNLQDSQPNKVKKKKKAQPVHMSEDEDRVVRPTGSESNITGTIKAKKKRTTKVSKRDEVERRRQSPKKIEMRRKSTAIEPVERRTSLPFDSRYNYDEEASQLDFGTYEDESDDKRDINEEEQSYSAPATPSIHRRLSALDEQKLIHVQRRRLSSKQIKTEEYTLPSASKSRLSARTTTTTNQRDEESNNMQRQLRSANRPNTKPPMSPASRGKVESRQEDQDFEEFGESRENTKISEEEFRQNENADATKQKEMKNEEEEEEEDGETIKLKKEFSEHGIALHTKKKR